MILAAAVVASFLVGSLPTGYWVVRWRKGVDLRTVGSGNVGATNVFRAAGWKAGGFTLAVDILKGFFPASLAVTHLGGEVAPLLVSVAAVLGHTFTPFLRFRGGKGVATSAGVFLALLPAPTLIAVAVFAAVFAVGRRVSLGSIAAAAALPTAAFALVGFGGRSFLALAVGLFVIVKHAGNIRRLIRGEEKPLITQGGSHG
jgi:glycerol-3-phosphate acyltransferase PlsY